MKNITSILSFLLIVLSAVACEDVFAPQIEQEEVFLLSPADSATVGDSIVRFWWEPVPNASYYQFQLVKGSFEEPINLVVDSVLNSNQYPVALSKGTYQWQVSAFNNNNFTPYYYRTVFIP